MEWLIIALASIAVLYLASRGKSEVERRADEIMAANPGIDTNLATAQAASQVADEALTTAQTTEVAVPEAQTVAELEAIWGAALTTVAASLARARNALTAAENAYNGALAVSQGVRDHIALVKASTGPQVLLYGDANYGGRSQVFAQGSYRSLSGTHIGNDAVSSLTVNKFFVLELYEHDDFGGKFQRFEATYELFRIPTLRDTYIGNDSASSLRIWPNTKVLEERLTGTEATVTAVRAELVSVKASVGILVEQALRTTADIKILGIFGARVAAVEATATQLEARIAI